MDCNTPQCYAFVLSLLSPIPDDVLTAQDEATPPFVVTCWLASSVYGEVMPRKKKGSSEPAHERDTAKRVNKQRSKVVDTASEGNSIGCSRARSEKPWQIFRQALGKS